MYQRLKTIFLVCLAVGILILIFFQDSARFDMSSFVYVDRRKIFGIPNFMDVISNLPFLIVGLMGLRFLQKNPQKEARCSWQVLFAGVLLVFLGSSFFHLFPSPKTLVLDRLPMTFGFMGLLTAFLAEFVDSRLEKWLLAPFFLVGVASVFLWYGMDDIRLYIWVQFFPLVILPIILLLFISDRHFSY